MTTDIDVDFEIGVAQNREELHTRLLRRLALFLMGISLFMVWRSLPVDPFPWDQVLFFIVGLLTGVIAYEIGSTHLVAARWLVILSINGSFLCALLMFEAPWLPFMSVLLIFVSTSIFHAGGIVSALPVLVLLNVLADSGSRNYPLTTLSIVIITAVIVAWLSLNTVMTALQWTQVMYQRTMSLLADTRENRAELMRLVKALEQSNRTLERMQGELVRARQQAEQLQLMKQQFAANISHELRSPLNLILGFSEIMYQTPSVYGEMTWPPRLRQDVSKIYRSSRHLLALIDDILDLTHFEVMGYMLYLEPTPVTSFLRETADMARDLFRGKPIEFRVKIEDNLPTIDLDRTRIRQVVLNLLSNAQRYTEAGTVTLRGRTEDHQIRISLEDTGQGIPAEQITQVFGEFYQADATLRRKNEGAGLGLAISKRFVEAHHGTIWVESVVGTGSTFIFTLPIMTHAHSKTSGSSSHSTVRPLVLVADANDASRRLLEQNIQDFDVIVVNPAEEKIATLVKRYAPRAILVNTENGNTWDAQELNQSPVPIIEYSIPWQLWIEHQLPVNGYLTKPVSPQMLMQFVRQFGDIHDVLVVDDDISFIHLVERTIQASNLDIQVRRAFDGIEALQAMRRQRPDLVLLDLVMPHMDGEQVLGAMAADGTLGAIPILLLTSVTYADDAREWRCQHMIIDRAGGLYPNETLRFLRAILHEIVPVPEF